MEDRFHATRSWFVGFRDRASRRPRPFYGIGPITDNVRTNFIEDRLEGHLFAGFEHRNHVRFEVSEGLLREQTSDAVSDPITSRFDVRAIPSWGLSHFALGSANLELDTRRSRDDDTGLRAIANATYGQDTDRGDVRFASVTLDGEAAVEISRPDRVLTLHLHGADTFGLGTAPIPFHELATLGGDNHVGFFPGRFRGESALLAELRYRWPIAFMTDAQILTSVGNVFAHDFSDFSFGSLTTSFAIGIRSRHLDIAPFEVMLGFGTTRFDQAFEVQSVRFYIRTLSGL